MTAEQKAMQYLDPDTGNFVTFFSIWNCTSLLTKTLTSSNIDALTLELFNFKLYRR